jgi:hypothetical protein
MSRTEAMSGNSGRSGRVGQGEAGIAVSLPALAAHERQGSCRPHRAFSSAVAGEREEVDTHEAPLTSRRCQGTTESPCRSTTAPFAVRPPRSRSTAASRRPHVLVTIATRIPPFGRTSPRCVPGRVPGSVAPGGVPPRELLRSDPAHQRGVLPIDSWPEALAGASAIS